MEFWSEYWWETLVTNTPYDFSLSISIRIPVGNCFWRIMLPRSKLFVRLFCWVWTTDVRWNKIKHKNLTTCFLPPLSMTLAVTTSNVIFDRIFGSPILTGLISTGLVTVAESFFVIGNEFCWIGRESWRTSAPLCGIVALKRERVKIVKSYCSIII